MSIMLPFAVQTAEEYKEDLRRCQLVNQDIMDAMNNAIMKMDKANGLLIMLEHSMGTNIEYLESTGINKVEDSEPEKQMYLAMVYEKDAITRYFKGVSNE